MNKRHLLYCFFGALLAASCNSDATKKENHILPLPGAIITQDSIPISGDINHFYYSVKVVADSLIADGVYKVVANYGPNVATGQFTMPIGGSNLVPILKLGTAPYTFVIGFKVDSDTTFYDYFEVSSTIENTQMKYLKSYSF